jgi:hypothetical protein
VDGGSAGPPRLFSWTVVVEDGEPPNLGAVGVSDNRGSALTDLSDALKAAPAGSHGLLHEVTVSLTRVGYWYGPDAVRADLDELSGEVVIDALALVGRWGQLSHPFGDAFPGL